MFTLRNIPWITDGANDFLEAGVKDGEIKNVLEFGSGASTYWLVRNNVSVVSVEHDETFYDHMSAKLEPYSDLLEYIYCPLPYEDTSLKFRDRNIQFDVLSIDGRRRVQCAKSSHELIKPGGFLMLDNDERPRYGEIHEMLSDWKKTRFEQEGVDYTGWDHGHPEGSWITTIWQKPQ